MGQDRNPAHLFPAFWDRYQKVIPLMQAYLQVHHPGITCKLVEGFRTAEYQHELYLKVPRVTWKDGYHLRSPHQSSMAADIGFFQHLVYLNETPDDINVYYGHCVRMVGLEWGGDWEGWKDVPHAQWRASDAMAYHAAMVWQKENNLA